MEYPRKLRIDFGKLRSARETILRAKMLCKMCQNNSYHIVLLLYNRLSNIEYLLGIDPLILQRLYVLCSVDRQEISRSRRIKYRYTVLKSKRSE